MKEINLLSCQTFAYLKIYFDPETSVSLSPLESELMPSRRSDGVDATFCNEVRARLAAREPLDSVLRMFKGSELIMLDVRTIGA